MARWSNIINSDRYLKCKNDNDIKSVKVYKICADADCVQNPKISNNDEIYIGRIQINTNGGKKRKFLYFQADYIAKESFHEEITVLQEYAIEMVTLSRGVNIMETQIHAT